MFTDRRTRSDDKLFLILLVVPAVFAGARFFETRSQMDQIALQNKPPAAMVATAPTPAQVVVSTSIVHRF